MSKDNYNFCILFDKNFLLKGMALYNSIKSNCPDSRVWILCIDDLTEEMLKKMNLDGVNLFSLEDIGDNELIAAENTRNSREFAMTCKASFIGFLLNNFRTAEIWVYLDADLFLFNSPESVFREFAGKSIMITTHDFSKDVDARIKLRGNYNGGLIFWRNNEVARTCISRWRERCLRWCYDRSEDGKFLDQLYLESWPEEFGNDLRAVSPEGTHVAPWNIGKYSVSIDKNAIKINGKPLIWYHFHGFKFYLNNEGHLSPYPLTFINKIIYRPYLKELSRVLEKVKTIDPDFDFGLAKKLNFLRRLKQNVTKSTLSIISR